MLLQKDPRSFVFISNAAGKDADADADGDAASASAGPTADASGN